MCVVLGVIASLNGKKDPSASTAPAAAVVRSAAPTANREPSLPASNAAIAAVSAEPAASAEVTSTPIPTTKATNSRTIAENLAVIEGFVGNQDKITEIDELLEQLDAQYSEDKQEIGDLTAGSFVQLEKAGRQPSIVTIMQQMLTVAEAKSGIS